MDKNKDNSNNLIANKEVNNSSYPDRKYLWEREVPVTGAAAVFASTDQCQSSEQMLEKHTGQCKDLLTDDVEGEL